MSDTDATGYGFLMAATGIGSLVAALGIAFSGRSRPRRSCRSARSSSALALARGLARPGVPRSRSSRWCSSGFGAIAMAATANTTIQLAVPDELRGRVISVYTTVFVGSTPLGGLLMGWIASAWGVDGRVRGRRPRGRLVDRACSRSSGSRRIQARSGSGRCTAATSMRPRDATAARERHGPGATPGSARPR